MRWDLLFEHGDVGDSVFDGPVMRTARERVVVVFAVFTRFILAGVSS